MNEDLICYEEKNCDKLQSKFLEKIGLYDCPVKDQVNALENEQYWRFVENEYQTNEAEKREASFDAVKDDPETKFEE